VSTDGRHDRRTHSGPLFGGHAQCHVRPAIQGLVGLVVAIVSFLVAVPSAVAGVGLSITPTFPTRVTVGQIGIPASIQVVNGSTPAASSGNLTINRLNLVPSCRNTRFVGNGDCRAAAADRGVFRLSATGTGEAATACADQIFTIKPLDVATGQVAFIPVGGPIVLTPPATPNSVCRVDFTFNVVKAPTKASAGSTKNMVRTNQIVFASGISAIDGLHGAAVGASAAAVTKAPLTIATRVAPATITLGSSFNETATLGPPPGAAPPTGRVTFKVYGPGDTTCVGAAPFSSTARLTAAGTTAVSGKFTPTMTGTYRVIATYGGDTNFTAARGRCDDADVSVVHKAYTKM
jgi:hypothetical protein